MLEEEQLMHALEISKHESEVQTAGEIEDFNKLTEEVMVRHALEMSMVDNGNDSQGDDDVKILSSNIDEVDVILIPDAEEDQEVIDLENSQNKSPTEIRNETKKEGLVNIVCRNPVSCKRKIEEFRESDKELSEDLDEGDQLKIAIEMSMSCIAEGNKLGNKVTTKGYEFSPCKKARLEKSDTVLLDNIRNSQLQGDALENNDTFFEKEKEGSKIVTEINKSDQSTDNNREQRDNYLSGRSQTEQNSVEKTEVIPSVQNTEHLVGHTEVIEINSQNSQRDETEDQAVDLISSYNSDFGEENNSQTSLMEVETGRNCQISQSVLEDSGKDYCTIASGINLEHAVKDNSGEIEHQKYSFLAMSDQTQETSLDALDSVSFLKDNASASASDDISVNNSKDIEDINIIPPSPEKTSSSTVSQSSFFSSIPDVYCHSNQTVQSPIKKLFDKEILSGVSIKNEVLDDTGSSHSNCININDKITKDERKEDFEREVPEESGDEEEKFDLKTSLFYNSSDSEYENDKDIVVKNNEEDGDQKEEQRNHRLNGNVNVPDVSENGVVRTNCPKSESRHALRKDMVAEFTLGSDDVNVDLLKSSNSEKYDTGEFVENNIKQNATSNVETDTDTHYSSCDKIRNSTSNKRELEDENDNLINDDGKDFEDLYIDIDDQIDFQPDSQDVDLKSESDSEVDNSIDLDENSQERNDPDFLPIIERPRSMRYRQLKEEVEQKGKLINKMESEKNLGSGNLIKTEVTGDHDHEKCDLTADEIYARQVQEDLDREAEQFEAQRALIDDEYIARQLHETLNKQTLHSHQERLMDNHLSFHNERDSSRKNTTGCRDNVEIARDVTVGNSEAVVRELQRRELEKIDRWRKMLKIDEKMAKNLKDINSGNAVGKK